MPQKMVKKYFFIFLLGNTKIVEILLRKPSLNYRIKNSAGQEASEVSYGDTGQAFDNFFAFQKKMMQNSSKVQIF